MCRYLHHVARKPRSLVAGPDAGTGDGRPAMRGVRPMAIAALTGGRFGPAADTAQDPTDGVHREQALLAAAFGRLPEAWQVVLWHRWVELAPAAEVATVLGRSPADVLGLEQTADRGLFGRVERHRARVRPAPAADVSACDRIAGRIPQGHAADRAASRRGGAPARPWRRGRRRRRGQCRMRAVPPASGHVTSLGGTGPRCARPGLTGLSVAAYRGAIGAGGSAVGAAASMHRRSERTSRMAKVGAVAGVVLALLAAAVLIRGPFGDLDSSLADFGERSASTTTLPPSDTSAPSATSDPVAVASRIELLFPDAPQGAVYVPGGRSLDLSISLSAPAPVYADGTGTIDVGLTNNDEEIASATYLVRTSDGIVFEALTDGAGWCRPEDDDGATCTVEIAPGERASMSLRFAVDSGGPDRVVIDPSISTSSLELPVVTVPGLVIGEVVRGSLSTIGNSLGASAVSSECRDGVRNASSALLAVPDGAEIERAVLVWEGDSNGWASTVGLIGPTTGTALPIDGVADVAEGLTGVVGVDFRSMADVTDVVRENGAGRYTVVRPPGTTDLGDGTWTLLVVSRRPDSPRRLAVVVRPVPPVTRDARWNLDVPIAGSVEVDPTDSALKPLTATLHARVNAAPTATQRFDIDETSLGSDDPFGLTRRRRGTRRSSSRMIRRSLPPRMPSPSLRRPRQARFAWLPSAWHSTSSRDAHDSSGSPRCGIHERRSSRTRLGQVPCRGHRRVGGRSSTRDAPDRTVEGRVACWRSVATGAANWHRQRPRPAARARPEGARSLRKSSRWRAPIWYPMWDAGVKLGHAVRTLEGAARPGRRPTSIRRRRC